MSLDNSKKKEKLYIVIYVVCLLILFFLERMLTYRQAIAYNGRYHSDLHFYVRQNIESGNERLIARVFHALYSITGDAQLIAVFMALVIVTIVVSCYFLAKTIVDDDGIKVPNKFLLLISLLAPFAGSIYLPHFHPKFYKKTLNSFNWHSPTQQLMLMFGLIALIFLVRMCSNYMQTIRSLDWILCAVASIMATWAKPSFILVMAPAIVIAFILELVYRRNDGIPLKDRFKRLFMIGLALVPAGLVAVYFTFWYQDNTGGSSSIIFGIAPYLDRLGHRPMEFIYRVGCGAAFPIWVFIFNYYRIKDIKFNLTINMLLVGFLESVFIHETGKNTLSGNFGWGRQFASFYFFLCAWSLILENWHDKDFMKDDKNLRNLYFIMAALAAVAYLISQICYYVFILNGRSYRC